jgi:hypothetical protein
MSEECLKEMAVVGREVPNERLFMREILLVHVNVKCK